MEGRGDVGSTGSPLPLCVTWVEELDLCALATYSTYLVSTRQHRGIIGVPRLRLRRPVPILTLNGSLKNHSGYNIKGGITKDDNT